MNQAVLQEVLEDSNCQRECALSDMGQASNALRNSDEIFAFRRPDLQKETEQKKSKFHSLSFCCILDKVLLCSPDSLQMHDPPLEL